MSKERVEYLQSFDFLYGWGLEKIETMPIPEYQEIDINDAIEYYQIHRYFKDEARSKRWTDEQYEQYREKSKKLFGLTNRFFHALSNENIVEEYEKIDWRYHSAFWELFDSTKLFNKISEEVFDRLLHSEHISIYDILEKQNLVNKYGNTLRQYILDRDWCADILIHFYEQDYNDHKKLFLPKELTGEEIASYLERYVDQERVHPNNLMSIFYMKNDRFPINDELRLKAQRRYKEELEKMGDSGILLKSELNILLEQDQEEERVEKINGTNQSISFSKKWLLETLDYPSILNNFVYLFEYADYKQMRCNLVSVDSIAGTLERTFRTDSKRFYPDYYAFRHLNGMALLEMQAYYHFLLENNIQLEEVLQWFFTKYLQEEFGCSEMRVSMPSKDTTYLEKCVSICTAMEMIIKQFSQYAQKKTIDFELLAISSGSPKYGQIPSLVDKKYIYGNGHDFQYIKHLLFSDQCLLTYVDRIHRESKKNYKCFFDLIRSEKIYKSDYNERYYNDLDFLLKHDLIELADDGKISFRNTIKLVILIDLNRYDVISRWHYPDDAQSIFQEWIDCGLLRETSTLLTEPESKYFNFLLNHAEYCNGFDLRNKYSHGNGQIIDDENEHCRNYVMLLILMTILTIKINDDFCLYEMKQKEEQS